MKTQRNILIAATLFFALAASPLAATSSDCTPQQEAQILALFTKWNTSLATRNGAKVDHNYAQNAVLIPTLSNQIRHNSTERIAYFDREFLPKGPSGKIDQHYLKCIGDIAINSGLYTFTFSDGTPKAQARYTFVYQKQPDGGWLIIEHHSSKMPKP
jgi:uncharacterized protein (TIGR02246 family)